MKAIVQDEYGPPEKVLSVRDLATPAPGPREVLVRVHAAAVHIGDCFGVRGSPLLMRLSTGLLRPKVLIPGYDLAGTVEATGSEVTRFRAGDEVFGLSRATCAELVVASEDLLVRKPANLGFDEAAAIPTSALAALHGLRDAGALRSGERVLVIGASGGVGSFAVQIARSMGAVVTGVCSTRNVPTVQALGADHVVDYTREDFSRDGAKYDLVFDNVENRSLADCRRALTPTGRLVLNSGSGGRGFALLVRLMAPLFLSPFVRHDLRRFLSKPNLADLEHLCGLAEAGALKPVIDQAFTLADTPAALRHIETGHARGKVIVRLR